MFDKEHELEAVGTLQEMVDESNKQGFGYRLEEELKWYVEMTHDTEEKIQSWNHPLDRYTTFGNENLKPDGKRTVARVVGGRCYIDQFDAWKDTVTGSTYVRIHELW